MVDTQEYLHLFVAAGTIVERRSVRMKAGRCFLVYLLTLATPLVVARP